MEANYVRKLETRQSKSNDIRESRDQDEVDRTQTAYRIGQIPGAGNLQTRGIHFRASRGKGATSASVDLSLPSFIYYREAARIEHPYSDANLRVHERFVE